MTKVVPNFGSINAAVFAIGEGPGEDEEIEGKPFVGPAGRILRGHLREAGIDPEAQVYYGNISQIRPPGNQIRAFFSDTGLPNETIVQGLEALKLDIERVNPNIIVPLGNYPLAMLTGRATWKKARRQGRLETYYTGIHDWRGSIIPDKLLGGRKCIPTFHPSFILREGREEHGTWDCDLQRIAREMLFPEIRRPQKEILIAWPTSSWRVIWDDERAYHFEDAPYTRKQLRDWLLADMSKTLTVDIEWVGGKLLCVGMTVHRDRAIVVPIKNIADLEFCKEILESGIQLNAQQAVFDVGVLEWHYGMRLMHHVGFDTMLAAHAANIELPKDLGYLDSIYTDQPFYKDMIDWKLVAAGKQSVYDVYAYNGLDVWTQHQVMEEQLVYDLNDDAGRDTFEFEMQLLSPLWRISQRGMRVDREYLAQLKLQADDEQLRNEEFLADLLGVRNFNLDGDIVKELLFSILKLPIVRLTPTGKPSTDDKVLAELEIRTTDRLALEIIRALREGRSAKNLKSKLLEVEFDTDSRSRGIYNPGGTDTGRLNSKKFHPTGKGIQQQNVKRKTKIRALFIPDDGYEFGYADLERAESLIVAHESQDERMLFDHGPGQDAHKNLASYLFDLTLDDITEDQRYIGKQTRHAGNYMEGWETFMINVNKYAHDTGVSITAEQAKFLIGKYRELHPGLLDWWDEIRAELLADSTLYNLLGRRRIFYGHAGQILPKAVAFKPQSTVGDVLNVGLLNLSGVESPYVRRLKLWNRYADDAEFLAAHDFQLLNQVHDSVCYQYPVGLRDEIQPRVRRLMAVPLLIKKTDQWIEIPVEVKYGKGGCVDPDTHPKDCICFAERHPNGSWGETKKYTSDLAMAA